jgi:hypothetical protein
MVSGMKRSSAVWLVLLACSSRPPSPAPPTVTGGDVEPGPPVATDGPGAPAPVLDQGTIRSRFRDCGDGFVGQVLEAPGARCDTVCATFGYSRCRGRAGQAGLESCRGHQPVVGPCDEAFQTGWASQCDCTNAPSS